MKLTSPDDVSHRTACPTNFSPVLHEPRELGRSELNFGAKWLGMPDRQVESRVSREQAEISAKRASPANAVSHEVVYSIFLSTCI